MATNFDGHGSNNEFDTYELTGSEYNDGATPGDRLSEESSLFVHSPGTSADEPIDVDAENGEVVNDLLSVRPEPNDEDGTPMADHETEGGSGGVMPEPGDEGTTVEGTPGEGTPDEGTLDEGTPGEATPNETTPDEATHDEETPVGETLGGGDPAVSEDAMNGSDSDGDSINSNIGDPEVPTWSKQHCRENCRPRWYALHHTANQRRARNRILKEKLNKERREKRKLQEELQRTREQLERRRGRRRLHTQVVCRPSPLLEKQSVTNLSQRHGREGVNWCTTMAATRTLVRGGSCARRPRPSPTSARIRNQSIPSSS